MNQVLMIPPNKFGHLKNLYKEQITSDSTLNTATELAAAQHVLLKDKSIPPGIKKAKVKAIGSTFNKAIKKYKQGPFTSSIAPTGSTDSLIQEDEQTKAFQKLLFNILRGQPSKKRSIPKPKAKSAPRSKTTKTKTRKTEAEKLISDWLPYNTRTQRWQRKET